jgi:hypothetical protein
MHRALWPHSGTTVTVWCAPNSVHVLAESLSASQARGALGHGRAGAVEAAQRRGIDFAQQVGYRARSKLLFQLVVGLSDGVAADANL